MKSFIFILIVVLHQIVVAFPDDGAWKRFHKQFDHFPMVSFGFHKQLDYFTMPILMNSSVTSLSSLSNFIIWQVVCNKVHEGDKRIVRIKEGNPAGYHVVIVDDLVQSGGTLIECQVIL